MKRLTALLVPIFCSLFCIGGQAQAMPLDLTTFTAQDSVTESGGTVNFTEDINYSAIYFYNDFFSVLSDAETLSFDYTFALGDFDEFDYFVFEVNFVSELLVDTNGSGYFELDLTPYQGTDISLAWGLIWGGDWEAGSSASVSNIDLAYATDGTISVPEPNGLVLFGICLGAFMFCRRQRVSVSDVIA